MADALHRELAGLGPFFVLDRVSTAGRPAPPWRSVVALAQDSRVLDHRVAEVRAGLARRSGRVPKDVPARIAASVTHLGLVARLLSPLLGLAVLTDPRPHPRVPGAGLGGLWWQPPLAGVFPLGSTGPADGSFSPAAALVGDLTALTDTLARRWRVSTQVLWGNVASAANGIATQVSAARPDLAGPIRSVTADLAQALPRLRLFEGAPGVAFRRRTCCLLVHAWPPAAAAEIRCGDCVLDQRADPAAGSVSG